MGILCLQWLREYEREGENSYMDRLALRQIRYRGMVRWKVLQINSFLPVTLQCALLLFFVAIIDLLWERNRMIATIVMIPIGFTFCFLVFTTIVPGCQQVFRSFGPERGYSQCPYKSPQADLFRTFLTSFMRLLGRLPTHVGQRPSELRDPKPWTLFDNQWRQRSLTDGVDIYLVRAFQWLRHHLCHGVETSVSIFESFCQLDLKTQKAIILASSDSFPASASDDPATAFDAMEHRGPFPIQAHINGQLAWVVDCQPDLTSFLFLRGIAGLSENVSNRFAPVMLDQWITVHSSVSERIEYLHRHHSFRKMKELFEGIEFLDDRDRGGFLLLLFSCRLAGSGIKVCFELVIYSRQLLHIATQWTKRSSPMPSEIEEMHEIVLWVLCQFKENDDWDDLRFGFIRMQKWLSSGDESKALSDNALSKCASFMQDLIQVIVEMRAPNNIQIALAYCAVFVCRRAGGMQALRVKPGTQAIDPDVWIKFLRLPSLELDSLTSLQGAWFAELVPFVPVESVPIDIRLADSPTALHRRRQRRRKVTSSPSLRRSPVAPPHHLPDQFIASSTSASPSTSSPPQTLFPRTSDQPYAAMPSNFVNPPSVSGGPQRHAPGAHTNIAGGHSKFSTITQSPPPVQPEVRFPDPMDYIGWERHRPDLLSESFSSSAVRTMDGSLSSSSRFQISSLRSARALSDGGEGEEERSHQHVEITSTPLDPSSQAVVLLADQTPHSLATPGLVVGEEEMPVNGLRYSVAGLLADSSRSRVSSHVSGPSTIVPEGRRNNQGE